MKKIMIASTLLIATTLAQANIAESTSMTVTELNVTAADLAYAGTVSAATVGGAGSGGAQTLKPTQNSGVFEMGMPSTFNDGSFGGSSSSFLGGSSSDDKVGQIISTTKEIVALGEALYTLVQKGKPSNTTAYAPISVVPRDPMTKEYVDPFELESCSMPITRKFRASMKSGVKVVVNFEYMLIYTVNCSFNGTGKYIANAMVQPVSVKTSFGWDFNATMKLNGVMNNGTKAAPVAGAMLTMKYQMNSWTTAFERNDTIYISGRGDIKTY